MKKHLLSLLVGVMSFCILTLSFERGRAQSYSNDKSTTPSFTSHKGAIDLRTNLFIPVVNWFYYAEKEYGDLSRVGFGYWNIGIDYYYNDNSFLNLTIGESYDLKLPAIITYGFGGKDSEHIQILHCSLSNNHRKGKLSIGYGPSYGYDRWKFKERAMKQGEEDKISYHYSHSLGFILPAYYYFEEEGKVSGGSYIGLIYRPMFLQFSQTTGFKYQHTLSLSIGVTFRVKK